MALIPLRAGPLEMVFDDTNAFLRYIRLGNEELIRGVFAAVRDRNWDTPPATLSALKCERSEASFEISFDASVQSGDVDFLWHGMVTGTRDAAVSFTFDGVARRSFLKNRIGLCVLHPDHCAALACQVEHTDGTLTDGNFPQQISPHQPFKNMRSIRHTLASGLIAEVAFDGEVFEMEDQRNWTDASFKTYCTPLELPFPVEVSAGQRIRQNVTLRIAGRIPQRVPAVPTAALPLVSVDWHDSHSPPPVGLGMQTTGRALKPLAIDGLEQLQPSHLRVDLRLHTDDWPQQLRQAAALCSQLNCSLHAALFLTDAAQSELRALGRELADVNPPISLWMIFHVAEKSTSPRWIELAQSELGHWTPSGTGPATTDSSPRVGQVVFAAGTNAYFAELNRGRPPKDSPALPCYSVNPQVHATDNLSLVETLAAQRATVESAKHFSSHPVVISPITLRPRFNPNATDAAAESQPQSDPRQATGFGAAWTAGSLANLLTARGIHSLTYFETAGPRGVVDEDGHPYPMYHVFAALRQCRAVHACSCDQPLCAESLAVTRCDGRRAVILASLTPEPQRIRLGGIDGDVWIRPLGSEGLAAGSCVPNTAGPLEIELPAENIVVVELD